MTEILQMNEAIIYLKLSITAAGSTFVTVMPVLDRCPSILDIRIGLKLEIMRLGKSPGVQLNIFFKQQFRSHPNYIFVRNPPGLYFCLSNVVSGLTSLKYFGITLVTVSIQDNVKLAIFSIISEYISSLMQSSYV